jgi:prevent-host-death family protein
MDRVSLDDAQHDLSSLVDRAAAGEEVIITRDGKAVARVVAAEPEAAEAVKKERRPVGLRRGKIWASDDFDYPLPDEILRSFGAVR